MCAMGTNNQAHGRMSWAPNRSTKTRTKHAAGGTGVKKKVFSLKSLLLSVLVAAVFIVAFLNSSFVWASIVVTLTLLLLMAAVVSSYRLPQTRPMLVCAAIVGISYGAAAFVCTAWSLGFPCEFDPVCTMFGMK